MIQLQSALERVSVNRDMIREEHFEPRPVSDYSSTADYNSIPYGNQTPSGGATPFRPQTPSHYGGATPQRPSTPHHDQDSSDHERDVHDQYSSNMDSGFNFMAHPSTPLSASTPMYSDNPKTPFDNNFQTPDTFNAPMTFDASTPMTFDPSNSVNTPGGYPNTPGNYPNTPGNYLNTPGGYPNTPGGYPNTPGGYPNTPSYGMDSNTGYGTPSGYAMDNAPLVNFQKLDKIVVVEGEFKGKKGFIANLIDASEGIVKFLDNEIKILKLSCLAKLD
jgi:hypothetical protein